MPADLATIATTLRVILGVARRVDSRMASVSAVAGSDEQASRT
jgi:hypothetical protein